jgi:hypothetical protein
MTPLTIHTLFNRSIGLFAAHVRSYPARTKTIDFHTGALYFERQDSRNRVEDREMR